MGIERYLMVIDKTNEWAGRLAAYLVIYIMLTLTYEVVARYVFNAPTIWVYEINAYAFCFYTALAGGYVMLYSAHVNVEIFYERFSPRKKSLVNILTSVCFFSVIITLIWKSGYAAWESWDAKEESFSLLASPIYPSKMIIPIGATLFLLQGIAKLIRDIIMLTKGDTSSTA